MAEDEIPCCKAPSRPGTSDVAVQRGNNTVAITRWWARLSFWKSLSLAGFTIKVSRSNQHGEKLFSKVIELPVITVKISRLSYKNYPRSSRNLGVKTFLADIPEATNARKSPEYITGAPIPAYCAFRCAMSQQVAVVCSNKVQSVFLDESYRAPPNRDDASGPHPPLVATFGEWPQ